MAKLQTVLTAILHGCLLSHDNCINDEAKEVQGTGEWEATNTIPRITFSDLISNYLMRKVEQPTDNLLQRDDCRKNTADTLSVSIGGGHFGMVQLL